MALESRILAVADVCEALTAKRPYRDALPREKVEEIMSRELGSGLCNDCYDGLQLWWSRNDVESRVDVQLEAMEKLQSELTWDRKAT